VGLFRSTPMSGNIKRGSGASASVQERSLRQRGAHSLLFDQNLHPKVFPTPEQIPPQYVVRLTKIAGDFSDLDQRQEGEAEDGEDVSPGWVPRYSVRGLAAALSS
jgi:hypothetical protein